MEFMRLHIPALLKWIDNESTLEKCPVCHSFNLEVYSSSVSQNVAHLRCECCMVPRLRLTEVDLYKYDNECLKDYLKSWIKAKKKSWDRLVHYCSISNKSW